MSQFSCWNNLIGIDKQCTPETPESGLFLQDLPLIDLKLAQAAMGSEDKSALDLLEKKKTYAIDKLISRIRARLAPNMKITSNIESDVIGFYEPNLTQVLKEAAFYDGIRVTLDTHPYLEFHLHEISLWLEDAVATNIKIFDLITGLQVGNDIAVTTVANKPTAVEVNLKFITEKQRLDLIIVKDRGVSDTFETSLHRNFRNKCRSCPDKWGGRTTSFESIKISQADTLIENNLVNINGTGGLSIKYSMNCSLESYICSLGLQLAWGLLHSWGAEVLRELQHNKRLNSVVTVQAASIKTLRKEFEETAEEFEETFFEQFVPPNDFCFNCKPRAGWQVDPAIV